MDRPDQPPQRPSPDAASSGGSNPLARLTSISGHGLGRASENGAKPTLPPPAALAPAPAPDAEAAPTPATMPTVGRLREGTATQLWPSDALFAAWVSRNLDAVADVTSLELSDPQLLEGATSVVMATLPDRKPVVFVPQRGPSTDDAFGALVRHVGASAAEHGVWICGEPASEHAAAVSWLNRAIDGRFLMLRVGAVTIGDSAAAPMFSVTVRSPRGDDPGVESTVPGADGAATGARRADDWVSEMREQATKP